MTMGKSKVIPLSEEYIIHLSPVMKNAYSSQMKVTVMHAQTKKTLFGNKNIVYNPGFYLIHPREEEQMININRFLEEYYTNGFVSDAQDLDKMLALMVTGEFYFTRKLHLLNKEGEMLVTDIPSHLSLDAIAKSLTFPTPHEVIVGYYHNHYKVGELVYHLNH